MIENVQQHQQTQHVNDIHSLDEAQNSAILRKSMLTQHMLLNIQKIQHQTQTQTQTQLMILNLNMNGDNWLSFSCAVLSPNSNKRFLFII